MKHQKQLIIIILSVLVTLAVIVGVFLGIRLFKNTSEQSSFGDTPNSANQNAEKETLPAEYDAIINNIINAYPWSDCELTVVPESPELSYLYRRNSSLAEIGFALMDLDHNGQEELIISDSHKQFVYDVYTLSDGKAIHIFSSGERYCYYLRGNGYIENQWSGSAATSGHDFYQFIDGNLTFTERITLDTYHALDTGLIKDLSEANDTNCYFRSTSDRPQDYKPLTSKEAAKAIENYQNANKPLDIKYALLSQYKQQ